ncbi:MAG: glycosyltransferase, partial [Gammaproteobacteria bacterium]
MLSCSIIIPTRDQFQFLAPCIESILASLDEGEPGKNIEIVVVDNLSAEPQAVSYLESLGNKPGFKLLRWEQPFNFSAINNYAAAQCTGEILCFLNNDIEISDPTWLQKLLPLAARGEVGAVGCVLLYPDGRIQHGGVELDAQAIARHVASKEPGTALEDGGITQAVAVDGCTAACLFTRKSLFLKLGGFNEAALPVAYNDVDYCLRLAEKGFPVLLAPQVKLLHHESVSRHSDDAADNRERAQQEYSYMLQRWHYRIADRHYESGIPDSYHQRGPLDSIIDQACENLYRDTRLAAAVPVDGQSTAPASSDQDHWRRLYHQLERSYVELSRHNKQVEEAHRLVANSIFWKMTWPLRWVRKLLSGSGGNRTSLDQSAAAEKKTDPQALKAFFDKSAKSVLDDFLAGEQRLQFCAAEKPRITILLVLYNQAHLTLWC